MFIPNRWVCTTWVLPQQSNIFAIISEKQQTNYNVTKEQVVDFTQGLIINLFCFSQLFSCYLDLTVTCCKYFNIYKSLKLNKSVVQRRINLNECKTWWKWLDYDSFPITEFRKPPFILKMEDTPSLFSWPEVSSVIQSLVIVAPTFIRR